MAVIVFAQNKEIVMPKNNHQSAQSSSIQEDLHVITNAANELVEEFGKDSEIGQSYTRLAEAANGANEALAILKLHMAKRLAERQA